MKRTQENTGLAKKNKMYYADKSEWKRKEYFYSESMTYQRRKKRVKIKQKLRRT